MGISIWKELSHGQYVQGCRKATWSAEKEFHPRAWLDSRWNVSSVLMAASETSLGRYDAIHRRTITIIYVAEECHPNTSTEKTSWQTHIFPPDIPWSTKYTHYCVTSSSSSVTRESASHHTAAVAIPSSNTEDGHKRTFLLTADRLSNELQ